MNIKQRSLAEMANTSTPIPSECASINQLIHIVEIEGITIGDILQAGEDSLPSSYYESLLSTVIDKWDHITPERNIADHFLALVIVLEQNPELFPPARPLKSILLSDEQWIECACKEQRRASNQYGFIMAHIKGLRESK